MALFPQSCLELRPGEASLIMQQKQTVPKLEQQLYLAVDHHLSPAAPHIAAISDEFCTCECALCALCVVLYVKPTVTSRHHMSAQDAVATIKRQLQRLLPEVSIFLDVSDSTLSSGEWTPTAQ